MRCLVIGYGSIGKRHARILHTGGCEVAIVSSREIDFFPCYQRLAVALRDFQPEYIVIANRTNEHYSTLVELINSSYHGKVLVEKPLFSDCKKLPQNDLEIFVGYNLRFHPIIQELKQLITEERILSVQIYVGQFLPAWRPDTDYRLSYSAKKELGGGVLRDLSHELDYLTWLFGGWRGLVAGGGHYSSLQIDSEDVVGMLIAAEKAPIINLQLNYLDLIGRREIIINTENKAIKADLLSNTLQVNKEYLRFNVHRDDTYFLQHQAILNEKYQNLCSLDEGMKVVEMIKAAEESIKMRKWVEIE